MYSLFYCLQFWASKRGGDASKLYFIISQLPMFISCFCSAFVVLGDVDQSLRNLVGIVFFLSHLGCVLLQGIYLDRKFTKGIVPSNYKLKSVIFFLTINGLSYLVYDHVVLKVDGVLGEKIEVLKDML